MCFKQRFGDFIKQKRVEIEKNSDSFSAPHNCSPTDNGGQMSEREKSRDHLSCYYKKGDLQL